jgi:hypothetical protein
VNWHLRGRWTGAGLQMSLALLLQHTMLLVTMYVVTLGLCSSDV